MGEEFQSSVLQSMFLSEFLEKKKSLENETKETRLRANAIKENYEKEEAILKKLSRDINDSKKANQMKHDTILQAIESQREKIERASFEIQRRKEELNVLLQGREETLQGKQDLEFEELLKTVCSTKQTVDLKQKQIELNCREFMNGIDFYQKYLQCKIFCERCGDEVFLVFTFDTTAKHSADAQDYIKFKTENECRTFQFVEMHPEIPSKKMLIEEFEKTNNTQALIVSFRNAISNKENIGK